MLRLICATLVVAWSSWCAAPLQAQRTYVLLAADMSPAAHWGVYAPNLSLDMIRMSGFFESNVPKNRLTLETLFIEDDEYATPEHILTALRALEPGPDDAVVFYYTGHGGIDDRGSYFDLAGGKLYREQVRGLLRAKQPRLAVLLTDCCNSRSDGRKQIAAAPFNEPPRSYTPLFTALFVQPKGIVDVNSSAPGQSAFFLPHTEGDPMQYGSIFTTALVEWAENNQRRAAAWDELVREVGLKVHATFHEAYPKGAKGAKGGATQSDQNLYAPEYPGLPPAQGLRAGVYVADNDGRSVRVTGVEPNSPAMAAYDVAAAGYVAVPIGGLITSVNGRGVSGAEDFQAAVKNSSQIMRLSIVKGNIAKDYLIRLRY